LDARFTAFFWTGSLAVGTGTGTGTGMGTGATVGGGMTVSGATVDGTAVAAMMAGTGATTVGTRGAGATGVTEVVGAVGAVGALWALPVPLPQPIPATSVNRAVVEAPAVMILEVYAGLRRFWRRGFGERNAASRSRRSATEGGNKGSIIVATMIVAGVVASVPRPAGLNRGVRRRAVV